MEITFRQLLIAAALSNQGITHLGIDDDSVDYDGDPQADRDLLMEAIAKNAIEQADRVIKMRGTWPLGGIGTLDPEECHGD